MTAHPEDSSCDVLVIGAGLAGLCAAYEAARAGARVLMLEKEAEIGGASAISAGFFGFAQTDEQRSAGIADDAERLYRDLLDAGEHKNDRGLLRTYADRQLDTYRWLKSLGVVFSSVELSSGQSAPRTHVTSCADVLQRILAAATATGAVTLQTATRVQRLTGQARIEGAVVGSPAAPKQIYARCGVVLATGGFSRNEKLLETFVPLQARAVRIGGTGCTGDGLLMAWQRGAGFRDVGYIKGTFGCHPSARETNEPDSIRLPIYRGAIAVNKLAVRFVDESLSYKLIGDACLVQPDGIAYQIFDAAILDLGIAGPGPFGFRNALDAGLIERADSLDALAGKLGIDAAALTRTVSAYNKGVESGRDAAFGRNSLSAGYGTPVKIERAPFYGYASTSCVLATYCGLTIDAEARVLDVFGLAIPGLYAAGELTGGFHGVSYMTGSALGKAVVFGRIAGANAASAP